MREMDQRRNTQKATLTASSFIARAALILGCALVLMLAAYGAYHAGRTFTRVTYETDRQRVLRTFTISSKPEDRVAAVKQLKREYIETESPRNKAQIINALTGIMHSAHESYIFEEIFHGEPFEAYMTAGSSEKSIARLNRLSLDLYPTAYATQQLAFPETIELRKLVRVEKKTEEQKRILARDVDTILNQYRAAQKLLDVDLARANGPIDAINILGSYYQWQGHLLGEVAAVHPEYLDTSLSYIRTALMLLSSFRDANGEQFCDTDLRIATLHLGYVRYVNATPGGAEAHPEWKEHADTFVDMLRAQWDEFPTMRIMLASVAAHLRGEHGASMGDPLHDELMAGQIGLVKTMWDVSPKAQEFFRSKGVDMSRFDASTTESALPVAY